MLTKEKTFTTRGNSAKLNRVKNLFLPNSVKGKSKTSYPSININSSMNDNTPPIIFTMPNNRKMTSGMGNKIEREQLYENNLQLRESLNKLERQLKKSKYLNVKTELELKKKEKLIQSFVKENSKEFLDDKKISTVKESALITLYRQKYNNIKTKYEKMCADNKILQANIKLTSIKEYQIENDILNKELKKIKALYESSKRYYEKYKNTMDKFTEFRNKFIEQHTLLLNSEKRMEILDEQIKSLTEENNSLKVNIEKIMKKNEKLKMKNKVLELRNKKFLDNKKIKESFEFEQNNYKKDYEEQKKEIFELKSALNTRISDIQSLEKACDTYKQLARKKDNTAIEPINYNNFKHIEKQSYPKDIDKIELYKSLYEESLIIIKAYENYFNEKNINSKHIAKKYGYNGMLNSDNKVIYNLNDKIKEKSEEKNLNNNLDYNHEERNSFTNTKTKPFSNENNNVNMNEIENLFLSLFVKNLEAKNITTEIIVNKIIEINNSFEGKNNISTEEFVTPFENMLIETMKIKQEEDKQQIKNFLNNFLNFLQNNMNEFIKKLIDEFENIINYDSFKNKEEYLNSLAFNLQKIKNQLIEKLKEIDSNNTNLINFQSFQKILSDLGNPLRMELLDFLLYIMKKNTDENSSMFDFNYNIILELLERKLPDDFEDNINEGESDEMSQLISNKLSEFKYNMEQNNTNLEKVCEDKIQKYEVNNKNLEVIDKNDFFELMEKYKVSLNEQIKNIIYKLFLVEDTVATKNGRVQVMDFVKLRNLFLNNYYEEENN